VIVYFSYSLFRHNPTTDQWIELAEVESLQEMIRLIESYFDIIEPVSANWLPRDYETAFKDENGHVYAIYRMDERYSRHGYDDYESECQYNDYYDDIDRQTDSCYAQQRRGVEKWEYVFNNPELLMKRYFPQPELSIASRQNEWYVGALHD